MSDTAASLLEIHVTLISGRVVKFVQEDAEVAKGILKALQPDKMFQHPQIVIGGDRSMSGFRTASIARIDLIADTMPNYLFLQKATNVQEISEDEFLERYHPEDYAERRQVAAGSKELFTAYTEAELVTGQRVLWEVTQPAENRSAYDMNPFIQNLMSSNGLYAKRRGKGILILNPANIARLTFHPGPPTLPPRAWAADRTGEE